MLKRIMLISSIVITLIVVISLLGGAYDSNKKEEIFSKENTDLLPYLNAKNTASSVKELISIRSNKGYIESKDKFRKILSTELYNEYFSTEKYQGGEKTFSLVEEEMVGGILSNESYVFKIDLVLVEEYGETPVTLLVYVKNNIIIKIKSLG